VGDLDRKALQALLSCSDNFTNLGDNEYGFHFENLINVTIVAKQSRNGWKVISVSTDIS
jgi:hypothetical protein